MLFGRNHRGIQLNACRGCHECDRMVVVQSVHMTIKVVSSAPSWLGVLDTTLCDKSLAVTCDRSVVSSGFLHQ